MVRPFTSVPVHSAPPAQPVLQRLTVAGCHGGAGTTTIARLLGRIFPTLDVQFAGLTHPPNPNGSPLLLVVRNHADGSRNATEMVNRLQRFRVAPLALVVVADGPWPDPPTTKVRLRMLETLVPRIVRFPFVTQWRYHDSDQRPPLPKKVLRSLADIQEAVTAATSYRRP